jgi:hypothetical protein
MKFLAALSAVAFLAGSAAAAEKVQWKFGKGDKLAFAVKKATSMESASSQGEFKSTGSSELQYRIEVAEAKGSDLELKVTYGPVKARQEGRERTWEFDSSKVDEGNEASKLLGEIIAKTIAVKVSGGKIADVTGFPEMQRPEGGQPNFALFQVANVAGRRTLQRDLEMILAAAVQGQPLEKDKEYKVARAEPVDAEKKTRGRFFGGGSENLIYKFGGVEKVEGQDAAKFGVTSEPPGEGRGEAKTEGKAAVSMADGALLRMEVQSSRKNEGERNGQSFKFATTSKTAIERVTAKPKADV